MAPRWPQAGFKREQDGPKVAPILRSDQTRPLRTANDGPRKRASPHVHSWSCFRVPKKHFQTKQIKKIKQKILPKSEKEKHKIHAKFFLWRGNHEHLTLHRYVGCSARTSQLRNQMPHIWTLSAHARAWGTPGFREWSEGVTNKSLYHIETPWATFKSIRIGSAP